MKLGIIIPSFNHFEYVHLACESAAKTPGALVIVIDDASPQWPGDRVVRGYLPSTVPFVIRRYDRNAGLSRSWNAGLRVCRDMGLPYAVCGNSDLVFPDGWFEPIEEALATHHFAGPVTNAPGHARHQAVGRYLSGYELSDDPSDIDDVAKHLRAAGHPIQTRTHLNGFCFAGRTESFCRLWFNESIPLAGNEDDFFNRAGNEGMNAAVVPTSFVFHYRSVSRGEKFTGIGGGSVRLKGCTGCGSR